MPMDISERVDRTADLIALLQELAKIETDVTVDTQKYIEWLKRIYDGEKEDGYRHRYSEISKFLNGDFGQDTDACSAICEALEYLYAEIPQNESKLALSVDKLIDHVSLEAQHIGQIQEIMYRNQNFNNLMNEASRSLRTIAEFENKQSMFLNAIDKTKQEQQLLKIAIEDRRNDVNELTKKVDKNSIESVSMLSIFAGVVFAFTGGFTMLGNVFGNLHLMNRNSAFLLFACIAMVGMVMYDVIYLLLWFVNRLAHGANNTKHALLWIPDAILILIAIVMVLCYYFLTPVTGFI